MQLINNNKLSAFNPPINTLLFVLLCLNFSKIRFLSSYQNFKKSNLNLPQVNITT